MMSRCLNESISGVVRSVSRGGRALRKVDAGEFGEELELERATPMALGLGNLELRWRGARDLLASQLWSCQR